MVPETAGALLAFLGLIAPGLVYTLLRERRQPPEKMSAFREASRAALTSLGFTVASLAVLVPLSLTGVWLPDIEQWLEDPGAYVPDHYLSVSLFLLLHVALSCGLAAAVEELTGRNVDVSQSTWGVWWHILNHRVPPEAKRVWLRIALDDGTQYEGPLRSYTSEDTDKRDIALGGAPLRRLDPGKDPDIKSNWVEMWPFDAVIVNGSQIRTIAVAFLSPSGPLKAQPPPARKSWLPWRADVRRRVTAVIAGWRSEAEAPAAADEPEPVDQQHA